MNDIIKARFFLKAKGSKLKDLTSFGLMLSTAERKYRDVQMKRSSGLAGDHDAIDPIEVSALLDYAVLKYLSKHNVLPADISSAVSQGVSLKDKRETALKWLRSNR